MNTFRSPLRRAASCFGDRVSMVDIASGSAHTFADIRGGRGSCRASWLGSGWDRAIAWQC